ncbi:MAG: diacylglycerol kinase [Hydrogenovibrio sp.]|uniref:diacylglycerol kinase n=1 Tax=Hydrogenovibrio sp. TaxID=2065821 RepID=UPI0028705CC7|nr:diacylglycerol kinase [Hydrogenovibrio sp.]MDR9498556.1 diacylglycerol kinase [Hydrogenovibrio sp.]MDR9499214.1 diacylglycerol kinase [Hydrogenovibrio sp.]
MKSPHTGITRILHAARFSWKGFRSTWKHEAAFRQEVVLLILLTPAAFWLGENAVDVALLMGVWLFVLVVELLNTAVETVVDRIGSEYHKLSGRAKDQGSAAVFVAFSVAILVWLGYAYHKWQSLYG